MFFDDLSQITKIASHTGTSIFVVPNTTTINIKNAIILTPQEKSVITIDQIRSVIERLNVKQLKDQYVIIRPADKMNEESANAFLNS